MWRIDPEQLSRDDLVTVLAVVKGEPEERIRELASSGAPLPDDLTFVLRDDPALASSRIYLELSDAWAGERGLLRPTISLEREDGRILRQHALIRPRSRPEASF